MKLIQEVISAKRFNKINKKQINNYFEFSNKIGIAGTWVFLIKEAHLSYKVRWGNFRIPTYVVVQQSIVYKCILTLEKKRKIATMKVVAVRKK